ncbi:hypothetical protein CPC08DRAFT_710045 [Agrocybe pediades]|nr:hypothetical protein CPC08DRAFT_710045 [Agrocybe pediades]
MESEASMNGVTMYGTSNTAISTPNFQTYYSGGHSHSNSLSSDSGSSITGITHPSKNHPAIETYNTSKVTQTYANTIPRQINQRLEGHRVSSRAPGPSHTRPTPTMLVPSYQRDNSHSEDDDEDLLEPPDENATEEEKAAYKRRKNTLSARRSRKRKALQLEQLEDSVTRLTREKNDWMERALTMERWLKHHKIPVPQFET